MNEQIRKTFNNVSAEYDSLRRKLIPCFDDFYNISVSLIDINRRDPRILDIGAGTGLLSVYLLNKFPSASLTLIDISEDMLEEAKNRFKQHQDVRFIIADYSSFDYKEKYDAIVSALSIHHLSDEAKVKLFYKCYTALEDQGIFVNADQVIGSTPVIESMYKQEWKKYVESHKLSNEVIEACYERMKLDQEALLEDQLLWLRQAGFIDVDCVYKYYKFAVMMGRKG